MTSENISIKSMFIYISGPYSVPSNEIIEKNIMKARDAAIMIAKKPDKSIRCQVDFTCMRQLIYLVFSMMGILT